MKKIKSFEEIYTKVKDVPELDNEFDFEVSVLIFFENMFVAYKTEKGCNFKEALFCSLWFDRAMEMYEQKVYGKTKRKVKSFLTDCYKEYKATDFTVEVKENSQKEKNKKKPFDVWWNYK